MTDRPHRDWKNGAPRVWRQDRGAVFAGVCAGLAEDLDLPLPLIRMLAVLFVLLPTGLGYLALALLLRRREIPTGGAAPAGTRTTRPAGVVPPDHNWALLRHRLQTLEPRLGRIEAFVTSPEFELHRDFRRMET